MMSIIQLSPIIFITGIFSFITTILAGPFNQIEADVNLLKKDLPLNQLSTSPAVSIFSGFAQTQVIKNGISYRIIADLENDCMITDQDYPINSRLYLIPNTDKAYYFCPSSISLYELSVSFNFSIINGPFFLKDFPSADEVKFQMYPDSPRILVMLGVETDSQLSAMVLFDMDTYKIKINYRVYGNKYNEPIVDFFFMSNTSIVAQGYYNYQQDNPVITYYMSVYVVPNYDNEILTWKPSNGYFISQMYYYNDLNTLVYSTEEGIEFKNLNNANKTAKIANVQTYQQEYTCTFLRWRSIPFFINMDSGLIYIANGTNITIYMFENNYFNVLFNQELSLKEENSQGLNYVRIFDVGEYLIYQFNDMAYWLDYEFFSLAVLPSYEILKGSYLNNQQIIFVTNKGIIQLGQKSLRYNSSHYLDYNWFSKDNVYQEVIWFAHSNCSLGMYNATSNQNIILMTLSPVLCTNETKATINYNILSNDISIAGINYESQMSTLVCNYNTLFETSVANYRNLVNSLRSYKNPVVLVPDCHNFQILFASVVCVGNQTDCRRGPCYSATIKQSSINVNGIQAGYCTISRTQKFNLIFYNSFQLYDSREMNISLYNLDENRISDSYSSMLGWGIITDVLGFEYDQAQEVFQMLIYVTENGNIFGNFPKRYGSVDLVLTMASPYVMNTLVDYAADNTVCVLMEGQALARLMITKLMIPMNVDVEDFYNSVQDKDADCEQSKGIKAILGEGPKERPKENRLNLEKFI